MRERGAPWVLLFFGFHFITEVAASGVHATLRARAHGKRHLSPSFLAEARKASLGSVLGVDDGSEDSAAAPPLSDVDSEDDTQVVPVPAGESEALLNASADAIRTMTATHAVLSNVSAQVFQTMEGPGAVPAAIASAISHAHVVVAHSVNLSGTSNTGQPAQHTSASSEKASIRNKQQAHPNVTHSSNGLSAPIASAPQQPQAHVSNGSFHETQHTLTQPSSVLSATKSSQAAPVKQNASENVTSLISDRLLLIKTLQSEYMYAAKQVAQLNASRLALEKQVKVELEANRTLTLERAKVGRLAKAALKVRAELRTLQSSQKSNSTSEHLHQLHQEEVLLAKQNAEITASNRQLQRQVEREHKTVAQDNIAISSMKGDLSKLNTTEASASISQSADQKAKLLQEVQRLKHEEGEWKERVAALKPIQDRMVTDKVAAQSLKSRVVLLASQIHKADSIMTGKTDAELRELLQRGKREQVILASDEESAQEKSSAQQFMLTAEQKQIREIQKRIHGAGGKTSLVAKVLARGKALTRENVKLTRQQHALDRALSEVAESSKLLGRKVLQASGASASEASQDADAFSDADSSADAAAADDASASAEVEETADAPTE